MHALVLLGVKATILQFYPSIPGRTLLSALIIVGIPATVGISIAFHRWIEAPAIDYGRKLRATWKRKAAQPRSAS